MRGSLHVNRAVHPGFVMPRRREIVGRKAPAGRAVVAVAPERLLCAVRSERIEANRVREGKGGDFGAVFRQAPIRHRYADYGNPCW